MILKSLFSYLWCHSVDFKNHPLFEVQSPGSGFIAQTPDPNPCLQVTSLKVGYHLRLMVLTFNSLMTLQLFRYQICIPFAFCSVLSGLYWIDHLLDFWLCKCSKEMSYRNFQIWRLVHAVRSLIIEILKLEKHPCRLCWSGPFCYFLFVILCPLLFTLNVPTCAFLVFCHGKLQFVGQIRT